MAFIVRSHVLADVLELPETTNVDKGDTVAVDCLDFQKVFNKILPQVFLGKNKLPWDRRGGCDMFTLLMKRRGTQRKNKLFFQRRKVKCGVPLISVIGPVLFRNHLEEGMKSKVTKLVSKLNYSRY